VNVNAKIAAPVILCAAFAATGPAAAQAPSVAMSDPWAKAMCDAWNADATLTAKLVESDWIKNDSGRGYKAMQIYRSDIAGAIKLWETSVRYDSQNRKAVSKLQEARNAHEKLTRMHKDPTPR